MGGIMRLKNKKTGEMGNLVLNINPNRESYSVLSTENGDTVCGNLVLADYDSLAELNAVWEDAPEEPKEWWYIDIHGPHKVTNNDEYYQQVKAASKLIGNYFETEEEAEKTVEKLKAFKRLKDKGFRFDLSPALGHCDDKKFDISIIGTMPAKWWYNDKVIDDIHYIFGGEE